MPRDLTDKQLKESLQRHGFRVAAGNLATSHPELPCSIMIGMALTTNRHRLAHCLRRLDEARAAAARRAIVKAAWEAEFSQPIEPNFWRERQ